MGVIVVLTGLSLLMWIVLMMTTVRLSLRLFRLEGYLQVILYRKTGNPFASTNELKTALDKESQQRQTA